MIDPAPIIAYTAHVKNTYPALTILIMANKAIGIVVALGGTLAGGLIIGGGIALSEARSSALTEAVGMIGAGTGIVVIIASLLAGLGLVAAGEWIELHIAIEQNTRPTAPPDSGDSELRWVA